MHVIIACRFCGERLDVWLLRRAEEATLQWHGLGELAHCSTEEALGQNPVLWLYGGERASDTQRSCVSLCADCNTQSGLFQLQACRGSSCRLIWSKWKGPLLLSIEQAMAVKLRL